MTFLQCGSRQLELSRPVVMGILNVTPDSFSDGGRYLDCDAAVIRALRMREEGAAIIDVGAESTRPGALPVSAQEELDRILPVIERLTHEVDAVISIDTSSPEVIRGGAALGVGFINDVRALRREGALSAAAATGLPVCLMHMQGEPDTMQQQPSYVDIVDEVGAFLRKRIDCCMAAGIDSARIVLDPGFGFGKTLEHNLILLKELQRLRALGFPVLAGLSRKSMLGALLEGAPVGERLYASISAAAIAVLNGASIVRVHDVRATCDAVAVASALLELNK